MIFFPNRILAYLKIVKGERKIKQTCLIFFPNRILAYLKIVKGERKIKQTCLIFFPNRILAYLKIVKGERKIENLTDRYKKERQPDGLSLDNSEFEKIIS